MRLAIVAAGLLVAGVAQAEATGTVQGMLGFNAETDYDEGKVKANGQSATFDGDDDDLESNFGLSASYEFAMSSRLVLGPRLSFMTGEGDDSENTVRTIDIGGIGRFFFNDGSWRGFAALGVGATYGMLTNDDTDLDVGGLGYHFLLGAGVQGDLGSTVGFIGGLYYEYVAIGSVEGDGKSAGVTVDVELDDATVTRPMLMAGITF